MVCCICNIECKNVRSLTNHLRTHKITNEEYYNTYIKQQTDNFGICYCGKRTKFYGLSIGFAKYCSNSCSRNSKETQQKVEQTNLKNHGTKTYNNRDKSKKTCLKKYNCDHPCKSDKIKNKIKQTCKQNNGCEYPSQLKKFIKKREITNIRKYGSISPMNNETIFNKWKKSLFEHFGYTSVHPKHLYYNKIYFDSSWELAYYIWLKDHNIDFEYQPKEHFIYSYNNKIHEYEPDFKVNGVFIEIKGEHFFKEGKMICPYDRKSDGLYEAKHQCMLANNIKIITDCSMYLSYIDDKYGKYYLKQFII